MARDMDFSARRRVKPPEMVEKTTPPKTAGQSQLLSQQGRGGISPLFIWLIIVIVLAVGFFAAWKYFKPSTASQKSGGDTNDTTSQTTPPTANSIVSNKNSLPTVQVYDSGGGGDEVAKLISNLKSSGYSVDNLSKSQFSYDKTQIWYRTGLQAEAAKIQSMMTGRIVTLKETKITGSFDILIFLGTK